MTGFGVCKLCGQYARLIQGHVIPKFSIDWLKRTSATGYIRQGLKPDIRKQDIQKIALLCANCERLFSTWENQFTKRVFIPFQEKSQQSFKYDEWLLKFAVSLAWRTGMATVGDLRNSRSELTESVDKALDSWRAFLLGQSTDAEPYAHHLLFLDIVADAQGLDVPQGFHWYLLRGVDATVVSSSQNVFVYTKLPGLIFWSGVKPAKPEGWEGTLVSRKGVIGTNQEVSQAGFGDFLVDRVHQGSKLFNKISSRQRERIGQALLENPERSIKSRTFETYLAERLWQKTKGQSE